MLRKGARPAAYGPVQLGRVQQLLLASGGVLGTGWLISGSAMEHLQLHAIITWLLGAVLLWPIAAVMIRLAQADSETGGLAAWPRRTSGVVAGIIVNAGLFVVYAGNPPAGAAAAVTVSSNVFDWELCVGENGAPAVCSADAALNWPGVACAAALMSALFLLHLVALRVMLHLNIFLSGLKVFVLVVLVVVIVSTGIRLPFSLDQEMGNSPLLEAISATAGAGVMFAFNGFQGPVDHGAEGGKKHYRFAIYGALVMTAVLYVSIQSALYFSSDRVGPGDGAPEKTMLIVAALLSSLSNALLFITLAVIVVLESVVRGVLALPKSQYSGSRGPRLVLGMVWLFGIGYLALAFLDWSKISASKSVIYLFVYSFAAISYETFRRTGGLSGSRHFRESPSVLAPLSFVVGTVLMFYTDFRDLLFACVLIAVIGALMCCSQLVFGEVADWWPHFRAGRWLFGYFGVLLVLSGCRFGVRIIAGGGLDDPRKFAELLFNPLSGTQLVLPENLATEYWITVNGLALVAAALGFIYYRMGVRESEKYIEYRNRNERTPASA